MSRLEIVYDCGLREDGREDWRQDAFHDPDLALADGLEWAAARLRDGRSPDAVLVCLINRDTDSGTVVSYNPEWLVVPLQPAGGAR